MVAPVFADTVVLYHTSDVHGGYSVHQAKRNGEQQPRGGFAALSALIQKETNPDLLIDSGDTFQGTPEGNFSKGNATVELMNRLGYSAMVPGNHDFDYGMPVLEKMARHFNFPVLAANVYEKTTKKNPSFMHPYIVRVAGGHKIAILGLAGTHTATSTLPANVKDYYFGDEPKEARKWVKKIMRKEKPDAIIILAHIGLGGPLGGKRIDVKADKILPEMEQYGTLAVARAVKGYPVVIFGGHNHTAIFNSYKDETSGVLLAESGSSLYNATRVTLDFDEKTGKLANTSGKLVELWISETGSDDSILPVIEKYKNEADAVMNQKISYTNVELNRNFREGALDSLAGDWFSDAMRRQAPADIGVQNSGGVRTNIAAGDITNRDIYQIMPFDNTLVVTQLSGQQVFDMVNDSIHLKGGNPVTTLQFSGLKAEWKITGEGENAKTEVAKVDLCNKTCDDENPVWTPVDFTKTYDVATNNYLVTGGNGGKVIGAGKIVRDNQVLLRDILIKDVKAIPVTKEPYGPRLIRQADKKADNSQAAEPEKTEAAKNETPAAVPAVK